MVFESLVVDMINRYLGTFVENLDKSQLSIGIWSGDVVLKKLNLKESALDSFNLPIKIKSGHLGQLRLKIPWKNLYTEPSSVHIQDICILAVHNVAIKYDFEGDRKAKQEEKQARLAQIEFLKNLDKEKGKTADPKQDSFVEKLANQIIKNLQVKVSGIHIRYEDTYTNPQRPFSIGVTLQDLVFQTTDSNWKETIIKEDVSQIYKLIRLDSLSVYWNSRSELMQDKNSKQILSALQESIPKQGSKSHFQYLFQPISAVAHLRLNTKPELMNLALPKIQLTLVFDEITMMLSKDQYDDILEMLEAIERMNLRNKYKETRPNVPFKGSAKKWWHHAYSVTLKNTVQRRRNMWKWKNLKKHRDNMKLYKELYILKIEGKKLGKSDLAAMEKIEEELDVFNICICRNQAELEIARLDRKRGIDKYQVTAWFDRWFTGKNEKTTDVDDKQETAINNTEFNDKFNQEFTDDEKGKLYKAIGYDANANDPSYPVEYVSVRMVMKLNKLSLVLLAEKKSKDHLLKFILTDICASFGQRPAADAIRFDVKVDLLRAIGFPRSDYTPKLINSVGVSKEANISLLTVSFETNPVNGMCDTRVRAQSTPLEIIYDAITVNSLATFFRPPESVKLKQLSYATMARYDEIISQTTAGVVYLMSERKYADIDVHLMPSYIIVPETGELKKDVSMLLLNLGSLNITSEKNKEMPVGSQMSPKELASFAYDKFNVSLDNVQLLFVQPGDTWKEETQSANSPLYILRPMSVQVLLEKCLFASDPNLPQFQVSGEMPLVAVTLSDNKLLAIMNLIQSIPLPAPAPGTKEYEYDENEVFDTSRITTLDLTRLSRVHTTQSKMRSEFTNLTQLSVSFIVKEVSLEIRETVNERESPFLQFIIMRIGANVKARTFDFSVEVFLGGIYLKHLQYKISENIRQQLKKCQVITGENVNILNSPFVDKNEPLLIIRFIEANKKGPEFKTAYNSTLQSITVEFSTLDVVLHQGVILSLMDFAKKLEPSLKHELEDDAETMKRGLSRSSITSVKSEMTSERFKQQTDVLQLKVRALVDSIQLGICNAKCVVMHSKVEGIEFGVGMQHQTLSVITLMRKIEVVDPDPKTFHSKIFSVRGTDMLRFEMTHLIKAKVGKRSDDINSVDVVISLQMGRARILFVNKFIMSIVHFFDNFIVAKTKLDEASRAVREVSMDVAKNLQEKIPRIKLDVMIKAPLIVVPQNSKSPSVLNIHLGDVTVQNNFEHGNIRSKTHSNLIWAVENMVVKLSNLCISRGYVQSEVSSIAAEIAILEPLSFLVDIRRNLSSTYFHGIPDVEVKAVLEKIDVKMNQEDVKLLVQIATENLDEIYTDGPSSAKARLVIVHGKPQSPKRLSTTSVMTKISDISQEVYCNFKMDFQLLSINIELYRGRVNLLQANTAKSPEKLLTYLTLKMLRVLVSMKSDTSMASTVYLHDISMDDCRSEMAGGTTKLLRRTAFKNLTRAALKVRDKEIEGNMAVYIILDQNSTKDKTINIHICSLHLCLCAKFIMTVAEFFIKALPVKDPDEEIETAHEVKAILEHRDAVNHLKYAPEMEGSIDIKLKMEKPEIYLIEDQMNPHTDSLIVNLELVFHVYMSARILNVNGGLSRFSLISCIFEKDSSKKKYFKYFKWTPDKTRKITNIEKELLEICYSYYEQKWKMLPFLNYVLTPVDITLIGSGTQDKDHHVDIIMTDFIVTITPSTVHFLNAVSAHLTVSSDTDIVVPKHKDYSQVWTKRKLSNCNYWFTQSVIDAGPSLSDKRMSRTSSMSDMAQTITILYVKEKFLQRKVRYYGNQLKEMLPRYMNFIIYAPVIVLKLEGGVGNRTVPLLIVESSISGQINNWTSEIYMKYILGVEVAYNNENVGVWEPVIEPVRDTKTSTYHKWNLSIEVVKNPYDDDDNLEETLLPPPKMSISIMAIEPLQLVLSKTCLKVLHQLEEAYSEASERSYEATLGQHIFPYQFKNNLGKDMILIPDSSFELVSESSSVDVIRFPSGKDIFMNVATKKVIFNQGSIIRSEKPIEKKISFQIADLNVRRDTFIKQARKRVYKFNNDSVVVSVEALIGQKIISFTSILQIKNHLNVPIEIKYEVNWKNTASAGEVYPNKMFNVPLAAVSSKTGVLFFQPKTEENCFKLSEGVLWQTITEKAQVKQMVCENVKLGQPAYCFNDTEEIYILDPGHNIPLNHASAEDCVLQITILLYRGELWTGLAHIHPNMPELSILTFESNEDETSAYMELGLRCKENDGSLDVTVYAPYWIVNLTDLDIALKENDQDGPHVHDKDDKSVMLFYIRDKSMGNISTKRKSVDDSSKRCHGCSECAKSSNRCFKRHKKVSLKIADAEWSDKFSLDTVGNSGSIKCKHSKGYILEVGVKITLASSGLTKIVTFTSFYLLINASAVQLSVREVQNFAWTNLDPGQCKSFYPQSTANEIMIVAKVPVSALETVPFIINKAHTTLLRLDDAYGGINAECQVSESAVITTFRTYVPGMATGLFVNNTSVFTILIKQIELSETELILEPQTSELYTWTAPAGRREIVWTCGDKKNIKSTLDRDQIKEYFIQNTIKIYFVSFLDGMQRVIMFTEDLTLATLAMEAGEFEQADQEINIMICEVGFSLINNEKMVEVAYLGITSSGVVWEEKKKRYKAIKQKDADVLEKAYQMYRLGLSNNVMNPHVRLENNAEVDFLSMKLVTPRQAVIRRSFENGIWMQIRMSPHSMQFQAKINRLQFDNQLRECVFPTILSPVIPPRSVAADRVRKPFIEVSLTTRIHKYKSLLQIKYFKILIQEMNLKIDQSFISGMMAMFASDVHTLRETELLEFKEDIALTQRELREEAGVSILAKRTSFFDYFHISPIKIHLSFSLQGGSVNHTRHPFVLDVFLQSVGVVLTDVHDVVFKLGYFEKNYAFSDNSKMTKEFIMHYSRQAIKQMYVLVLGLDVLGNPYGLLRGLTEGIEDLFYEPYQGAIQGPQEFVEGLVLGVRSLIGHTVGGTANAISRILGTLGEGLAAFSFDEEYKRRRLEQYRKRPTSAGESFARGGREMVVGVFEGVTGIARQPLVGARQEGVSGFVKGIGRGVVGVIIKPTTGVMDFASNSLEGIRRITDVTEEVQHLRPPRMFTHDGVIHPFIYEEAEGYNLMQETDKGRYIQSDEYVTHIKVKENKLFFIVTDKRIMLAKREIFGSWCAEWMFMYEELADSPNSTNSGIEIILKEKRKRKLCGGDTIRKEVPIADTDIAEAIVAKIAETMKAKDDLKKL